MSDTPRTDDIWFDTSRKYSGALASSLYDLSRELERENAALRADLLIEEERSIYWRDNEGKAMAENAALRAALDSLRTKIADAAKGDCRKLHDFERIALAMKEAQP
jgi:hypothetical protein